MAPRQRRDAGIRQKSRGQPAQCAVDPHRVLKPGGSLVLSDILFRRISDALSDFSQVPRANHVAGIAEYRARLAAAGFAAAEVEVEDATELCLRGFCRNLAGWPAAQRRAGRMKLKKSIGAGPICKLAAAYFGFVCKTYLLVAARKAA